MDQCQVLAVIAAQQILLPLSKAIDRSSHPGQTTRNCLQRLLKWYVINNGIRFGIVHPA